MYKRYVLILLFCMMGLCFLPTVALADGEVCKIVGSDMFMSVTDAISETHIGEDESHPTTIQLIMDTTEKITIPAERYIVLDLNGHVLSGNVANSDIDSATKWVKKNKPGNSTITNNGNLKIIDSNPDAKHYFNYSKINYINVNDGEDKSWKLNITTDGTDAIKLDEVDWNTEDGAVIEIEGGIITGGNARWGGGINNKATLTLLGGNIVGNVASYYAFASYGGCGGGVSNSGTFTMKAGKIIGNCATNNAGGAIINMQNSTFIMENGLMAHNIAVIGGAVQNYNESYEPDNEVNFTMTGGNIEYNIAKWWGSGICNDTNKVALTLLGGKITNNESKCLNGTKKYAGGVYIHTNTTKVELGGSIVILGNTKNNVEESNLYFRNSFLNYTQITFNSITPLTKFASIGITTEKIPNSYTPTIIVSNIEKDYSKNFSADNSKCYIEYNSIQRCIGLAHEHEHEWSYKASGATIIATCANTDGKHKTRNTTASITLKAPEISACGSSNEATIIGNIDGVDNPNIEYYTSSNIRLNSAPIRLGEYIAKITLGGKTACVNYTIGKTSQQTVNSGVISKHKINNSEILHGKVVTDLKSASTNKLITITVKPDNGYALEKLIIKDFKDNEIDLTEVESNKIYTFKMPSKSVNISANFVPISDSLNSIDDKFFDINTNDWYYGGVKYCTKNKIMNGVSDTKFAPSNSATRAMIVTILWNIEDYPFVNYAMKFNDVNEDDWYTEGIRWAQSEKIVEGYNNNTFGVKDNLTREQMAVILYNYAKYKGINVDNTNTLNNYIDKDKISIWAVDAVKWANSVGVISGRTVTTLEPKEIVTRAEVATMMQRFCENLTLSF